MTPLRLISLLGALGWCAISQIAHADTVKLAFAGPTTGPLTQYGDMVKEGIYTAVERINAAGGVLGRRIEVVEIDDGCEAKQGPLAANRVINDGIRFVVGHVCSGASIAAADIYDNEGVVMVTPSATSPSLTDGKHYEYIFRTIGRDDQQGPAAARFIIDKIKPTKVAVIHDKQSYGQGIAASVRKTLLAAGLTVPYYEGINAGDSDYSSVITRLRSEGIDFVYYGGYHPELGLLMRQAREQGLSARFMGPEGAGNPDINAIAGEAVEGMLLTLPANFASHAENAEIVKAFADKNRNAAGAFQLAAYTATQVIAEGIAGAGSTDAEPVAKYLHSHTFQTPIGQVAWNAQGDLESFEFEVFTWHSDARMSPAQ